MWIREHRREVNSFTAGAQTRASRAKESSLTHKLAIADHAVEESRVIDWDGAGVVDGGVRRWTGCIKGALWIVKTSTCMGRDAGSRRLGHTWD